VGQSQTFIQSGKTAFSELSSLTKTRARLLVYVWIIFLLVYAVGMALLGEDATALPVVLSLSIPIGMLVWSRPEIGLLGIVFLTSSFIPPDIVDIRIPIGGGLELRDMAILGMMALMIIHGLTRRAFSIPWWPVAGPLLGFLLLSVLSAIWALGYFGVNPTLVLSELRAFIYYGTFFIAAWSIRQRKQVSTLIVGLFLIADLTAVVVILQQFLGTGRLLLEGMGSSNWLVWSEGGSGLGSVRIIPAGHVLMVFMMVIAFCMMISSWKSQRIRYLSLFHIIFLNLGLLFTFTRAQWLGAAAAILVAIIVLLPHYRVLLLRMTVIGLAGLIFIVGFLGSDLEELIRSVPTLDNMADRALSIFEVSETVDSNSLQWRLFETEEAFRSMGKQPWLGVGLGNSYRSLTTLQGENLGWFAGGRGVTDLYRFTRFVHNSFLMIAVKIGIPGILFFLWFSGAFLVGSWFLFRRITDDTARGIVLGAFTGFIGVLLWSIFHSHLMETQSTPVISLMVGLVAGIGAIYAPETMSTHAKIRSKLIAYPKKKDDLGSVPTPTSRPNGIRSKLVAFPKIKDDPNTVPAPTSRLAGIRSKLIAYPKKKDDPNTVPALTSRLAGIRSKLIAYPKKKDDSNTVPAPTPKPPDIPSSLRSRFSKGFIFTLAGSGSTVILLFIETMIASRLVDTYEFGIYLLAIAVANFFVMAIDFGFTTAITQMVASSDRERQLSFITSTLLFRLGIAVLISALILLGRNLLSFVDPTRGLIKLAPFLPLMIAVYSFDELFSGMLQGFQAYRKMATAQITRSFLRLGLSLFFIAILKLGMMSLIYSWLISFGISAIYQYIILPIPKRISFNKDSLKEILKFGAPIQVTRFLWFSSGQIHIFLLSALSGPVSVAIYGIASRIPTALQRLSQSYTAVFFPTITTLLSKDQREDALSILNASLRLLSFAGSLVALVAILFSHDIVVLLFSEKYAESAFLFGLLTLGFHMGMLVNLMGYSLTAAGYPGRSLSENFFRTIINIGGSFVLIPILGYLGPALARLAAAYSSTPLSLWLLRRSDLKVDFRGIWTQTLLILSCAGFYWGTLPASFVNKMTIIGFFILSCFLLTTISMDDIKLVIPKLGSRKS